MAEGINVRLSGKLRLFVEAQVGNEGLYESVSEYVRSLIRLDFERTESQKWEALHHELLRGLEASESEFIAFNPEVIKASARQIKRSHAL